MRPLTRRPPGPRRTLSAETVLDAAMALMDGGGADAVTIRGIASELSVAPNAVYTYFAGKAAVLQGIAERLLGELDLAALTDPARPWRTRLHTLAAQLRETLLGHPGSVSLLLGAPMDGPNALALGERLLAVFAEAGLRAGDAARASYLLTSYALGSIALEAAELDHAAAPPPEEERVAARLAGFSAVPADRYPRTAAVAETMAGYISTEQFTWGLDRLLDGLCPASTGARGAPSTARNPA